MEHKEIIKLVAKKYDVTTEQLLAKNRKRKITRARQVCCWIMKYHFNMQSVDIAYIFKAHHTSVLHSIRCVDDMIFTKEMDVNDFKDIIEDYYCKTGGKEIIGAISQDERYITLSMGQYKWNTETNYIYKGDK